MKQMVRALLMAMILVSVRAYAEGRSERCAKFAAPSRQSIVIDRLKKAAIDKILEAMAYWKGLPQYLHRNEELKTTGRYLDYAGFGEMGLAEMDISVRYDQTKFSALNTGRPLIIIANHHLGIADGLALQYLAARARPQQPSLLFLARWIEKLLPHAVFGDKDHWGTAIPVEINKPKETDAQYESKMADLKSFNSAWSRISFRVLRNGGALVIFPAGHVASIDESAGEFPGNVFDAPDSWQDGFLNLARLAKADIVFAHVDSVNSEVFYRNRKRFGGGDKERVIWFFSEALAKKGQAVDVHLSPPLSLDQIFELLNQKYGFDRGDLERDPQKMAELMRQLTYEVSEVFRQSLDAEDSPKLLKMRRTD